MKTTGTIYLAVFMLFLSGCATGKPKLWNKPGATADQFNRDQLQCRQYGMQSAMANGLAGNLFVEIWVGQETEKCLTNLGYTVQQKPLTSE